MQKRIECRIRGRVQMVMFRDFVTRKARSLGLVGQVENLLDGTVHVIAEGDAETLRTLIEHLHKGSLLSRVEGVEVTEQDATGVFTKFAIKY